MLFFPAKLSRDARNQWLDHQGYKNRRPRGIQVREYTGSVLQWSVTSGDGYAAPVAG